MTAPAQTDDDLLVALVERALHAQEHGEPVDVEQLCHGAPHLVLRLRQALGLQSGLDRAWRAGGGDAVPDPLLGRVIGARYELRQRIGMGAMGAVFAGHDRVLDRAVAVKVLDPSLFLGGERRARFQREARAIAALSAPGIVAVFDHGEGEWPFLVMELVVGLDLARLLAGFQERAAAGPEARPHGSWFADAFAAAGSPVPDAAQSCWQRPYPAAVAALVLQAARALAAAHARGVLHRDIKPSNLLVKPGGQLVVVDFGLARLPGEATLTRGTGPLGTPWYMAPEQAAGGGHAVTEAADVYSLGSTLYHLLALAPPFGDEPAVVLGRIQHDEPPSLLRIAPRTPRDLAVVCHQAMEKRPADRYASMAAFADDLEAFLDLRPIQAAPPSWLGQLTRRVRRRPARALAVAMLLLLVPVSAALWVFQGRDARAARWLEAAALRARLPGLLTIEGDPRYNLMELNRQDDEGRALLDQLLAVDPDDEPDRLLRAVLRLDQGDVAGGVADLELLRARHPDSEPLRLPLDRLKAPGSGPAWTTTLPLEPLPAARSAFDHFLLGYWQLRAGKFDVPRSRAALASFDQAVALAPQWTAARDLRLLALLATKDWDRAQIEANRLEELYGAPTARTQHTIAAALLGKRQPRAAIPYAERSLLLRPGRHGPEQNLGYAYYLLGDHEQALTHLRRAFAIRPELANTVQVYAMTLRALGRYAEAREVAARIPPNGPEGRTLQLLEIGNAWLEEATGAAGDGERERCRDLCRKAREPLAQAREVAPAGLRPAVDSAWTTARLLASGDYAAMARERLRGLRFAASEDPASLRHLAYNLLLLDVDRELALYFLFRAHALAPADRVTAFRLALQLATGSEVEPALRVLRTTLADGPWLADDRLKAGQLLARAPDTVLVPLLSGLLAIADFAAAPLPEDLLPRLRAACPPEGVPAPLRALLEPKASSRPSSPGR